MTHNDSHLMALIDELKQSRNVMDQRKVKTLAVLEGLLKRIERLESPPKKHAGTFKDRQYWLARKRY